MTGDYRYEQALRHLANGQTQQAIDQLVELLAEHPDEAVFHGLLASCLLSQKRMVAARHELDIAFSLEPESAFLQQIRAEQLMLDRKLDDAIEACDEALRLEPESADCHLLKSRIYELLDRPGDAKASIDRAAALDPDAIEIAIAYGDYFNARGDHKTAHEHALAALQANASSDTANLLMGETLLALGDTEQAEYHAKFALIQNPESRAALVLFANIRMRKNPLIGLWWRFNSWLSTLGNLKGALVLILGYLTFNLLAIAAGDLGYATAESALTYGWLILVAYSWFGLPVYYRALKKELESFRFNPNF